MSYFISCKSIREWWYFFFIKPFHKFIVPMMLKNTIKNLQERDPLSNEKVGAGYKII